MNNQIHDIKEYENTIKNFYRAGYKALRMGRNYFKAVIISIVLSFIYLLHYSEGSLEDLLEF